MGERERRQKRVRTGREGQVHASCDVRDWGAGAGTGSANQLLHRAAAEQKGELSGGLGLARELQSETKNMPSQVGARGAWARDPACHDILVSLAGRGRGRRVGQRGDSIRDQGTKEIHLHPRSPMARTTRSVGALECVVWKSCWGGKGVEVGAALEMGTRGLGAQQLG